MKTDIITPNLLHTLSKEKQKDFEGILPLLVKKLIINSCESISSIRMPHGDDIWAPGFDGIICCETQSTYVLAGLSVWEFGTNEDSLGKLNDDYEKRTKNSLGIEKEQSCFIFVTPKIWAYNKQKTITEWETEHTDWKQVKVYDASILCDWINNEPAVCAWLIEEFFNKPISFSTIEKAWNQFSNKTSPCLSNSLFLLDRESELDQFTECLSLPTIRVKANTVIEAEGFVLSAMMENRLLRETCIVVHDENAYYSVSHLVKNKTLVLTYPCSHDLQLLGDNKAILCYGKGDTSINADIILQNLSKSHFINSFKDMGIPNAEELYYFTHGNLRALIRRIPGLANETKPDWADREKKDLLAPLLFLRSINMQSEIERKLIEMIAGESFESVEKEYQNLSRMEDSPIKVVDEYYVLINYEETWNTLQYTTNSPQFTRLTNAIKFLLKEAAETSKLEAIRVDYLRRSVSLHNLFLNYIYFSFDDPSSQPLKQAIRGFLEYFNIPATMGIILHNLSILAEAAPDVVASFIDITSVIKT